MAELDVSITGYVVGDDLQVRRTITGLDAAAIEQAWLTFKRYPQESEPNAPVQKVITTIDSVGVGHVEEAGGGGADGELRFDLTPDDTNLLGSKLEYYFDVQVRLESGAIYTAEVGRWKFAAGVTSAE